jgi:hypothetical protein
MKKRLAHMASPPHAMGCKPLLTDYHEVAGSPSATCSQAEIPRNFPV